MPYPASTNCNAMKNIVTPATITSGRPGAAADLRAERDTSDITLPFRHCRGQASGRTLGVFAPPRSPNSRVDAVLRGGAFLIVGTHGALLLAVDPSGSRHVTLAGGQSPADGPRGRSGRRAGLLAANIPSPTTIALVGAVPVQGYLRHRNLV